MKSNLVISSIELSFIFSIYNLSKYPLPAHLPTSNGTAGIERLIFSALDTVLSTAQREENEYAGGDSINTILFGSFWFGDWYTTYGFGLGISKLGGAAFIPADLRIGWQPGSRKNKRCAFKLEFAAMGSSVARYRRVNNGNSYEGNLHL